MKKLLCFMILIFLAVYSMNGQEAGFLTGTLTDHYTAEPLFGVKVTAGGQIALSDENGTYFLALSPGLYNVRFNRYGLETVDSNDVYIPAKDTVLLNLDMSPIAVPVAKVIVNEDVSYLEINWIPSGPCIIEKSNDEYGCDDFFVYQQAGSQVAVKFDNSFDHIVGGRIFVGDSTFPGPFLGTNFLVRAYDNEGMEGLPGNTLDEDTVIVDQYGWQGFDGLDAVALTDQYYLGTYQLNDSPECAPVGFSQYPANINTLLKYQEYNWYPSPLGNAMIRPWIAAPHDSLYVENYRVGRFSNLDPTGDPQSGTLTELASTGNCSYYDYAWTGLPGGCYAYGIKAFYSNGTYSPYKISNIVCEPPHTSFAVKIDQTDSSQTAKTHIVLTGETLPYHVYSTYVLFPDTARFSAISMGTYQVSVFKPGYEEVILDSVAIHPDTLIECTLQEIRYPVENLRSDAYTGSLSWEPKQIPVFFWQCEPDSVCHIITTPDLDLTCADHWRMTVVYRYTPGFDPASVNYSTDHGRTWATLVQISTPNTWDTLVIDLSEFSGVDGESAIMFQVSDVFGAPYYLDLKHVSVWSPDLKNHPDRYIITLNGEPEGICDTTVFQLDGLINGLTYRAGVNAEYSTGITDTVFTEFTYHELFPPENLHYTELYDTVKFTWSLPHGSWNEKGKETLPDFLAGYVLTYYSRGQTHRFEINDPEDTTLYIEKPDCDTAIVLVYAVYDLSVFNYPGGLAESEPAGPMKIDSGAPIEDEFLEDWSSVRFVHNCWTVTGNGLAIEAGQGYPGPTLVYLNPPSLYQVYLTSHLINIPRSEDADLLLEFDLNLFTSGQGGYETVEFQVQNDGSTGWDMVQGVSNAFGNINWQHFQIDLSQVITTDVFRLRLKFEGIGAEPVRWKVDNIHIYNYCRGPVALSAELINYQEVKLNWENPLKHKSTRYLVGYNVYRDYNGSGYSLLTTVTDTTFSDMISASGKYSYRVSAFYTSDGIDCESPLSDSAYVISNLSIPEDNVDNGILCYPNPANDVFYIKSEEVIQKIKLFNSLGENILTINDPGRYFEIGMKTLRPGIYFLRIEQKDKFFANKIIH
jgi:hypothetical protein